MSCVSVTDLRDDGAKVDVPTGQVDTGWQPDGGGLELPPSVSCATDADCATWLDDAECLVAVCAQGACAASSALDGLPCTDGRPSTRGDRCSAGRCVAGPDTCLCATDADCAPFDDATPCDGRLACDGCGCVPVETPAGSACDDGDPNTVNDVCVDERTCRGATPCLCSTDADCPAPACSVSVCAACACRSYSDAPGTVYATADTSAGLPTAWTTTSTNPMIVWRGDASGGLRATGPDGSYDHGAVVAVLSSPPTQLPAGALLVELRIGLLSAEPGCEDRLEVRVGDELVDTLCGPTAVERRLYPHPGGASAAVSLTFIADDTDNAGAGAVFEQAVWRRVAPSLCGGSTVETAIPGGPGHSERSPDVALSPLGGWLAAWEDEQGVWLRSVSADVLPTGESGLVDAGGTRPALTAGWLAWQQGPDVRVRPVDGLSSAQYTLEAAQWPDVDAASAGEEPAIAVITSSGTAELRTLQDEVRVHVPDALYPGRAAATASTTLVVATAAGVSAVSAEALTALLGPAPTGRPDAAIGMGRIAAAWPNATGLSVATDKGEAIVLGAVAAADVAIESTATGWVVIWVSPETNTLAGCLLTGTLSSTVLYPTIATYVGPVATPRLARNGTDALAVWQASWLDGDAQTVVIRALENPLLGP